MNAKKHICPETIKISYNLQGLWKEPSFSFAQHLSTPAGSPTLLEKPKLGRCRFSCHWLLLQAPKSAGLPQLTCSTARQCLQRLQGWAHGKAGCAARRRNRAAPAWEALTNIPTHPAGMGASRAKKHRLCRNPKGTATTCRQPSTSRSTPDLLGIQACGIRFRTGYKEVKKYSQHLFSWISHSRTSDQMRQFQRILPQPLLKYCFLKDFSDL